jgi:AcrR family transcriptional regulator
MARTALAAEDIAELRKKATAAAIHLFATQGYDGVTMRSLAAALGVSAMTPYRYLAGKEELFALVRSEAFRRFADALEASLARKGEPMARLRRLKKGYIQFAVDEPDAYRIMFELRQPDPASFPELVTQSRRAFACLHRTVKEAVDAGAMHGDALTLAHLLWANTHGLVSLHLAGRLNQGRTLEKLATIDHELVGFMQEKKS